MIQQFKLKTHTTEPTVLLLYSLSTTPPPHSQLAFPHLDVLSLKWLSRNTRTLNLFEVCCQALCPYCRFLTNETRNSQSLY
jgi:hypothetical protein